MSSVCIPEVTPVIVHHNDDDQKVWRVSFVTYVTRTSRETDNYGVEHNFTVQREVGRRNYYIPITKHSEYYLTNFNVDDYLSYHLQTDTRVLETAIPEPNSFFPTLRSIPPDVFGRLVNNLPDYVWPFSLNDKGERIDLRVDSVVTQKD